MSGRKVVIADYGVGNLLSVHRAMERCGGAARVSANASDIRGADRLVLPGVGAFGDCMAALRRTGLLEPVLSFIEFGRPMLGVCVGMQILLDDSDEFGPHEGLGLIPGVVRAVPSASADGRQHKIPHTGWTPLEIPAGASADRWRSTILTDTEPGAAAYFVHSYTAHPADPAHRLADVHYGGHRVAAAVVNDNVTGTQFHPEKSGPVGLRMLERFLAL